MRIEEHRIAGDCLEGVGIPGNGGIAVIDRDAKPRVFDIVWCNKITDTVNGFLKEIVQTGEKPVVRTHYKDRNMDYVFFAPVIYGVVLKVLDQNRNVVWERPQPTSSDGIRAMTDEELADAFAAACPPTKGANRCCEYYSAGTDGCRACWLEWLQSPADGGGHDA